MRAKTLETQAETTMVSLSPGGFARWACVAAKLCAASEFSRLMRFMAELGLDLDAYGPTAQTAAMACARHGFGEGLALCVELGCDLSKPGRGGRDAMSLARESISIVEGRSPRRIDAMPLGIFTLAPDQRARQVQWAREAIVAFEIRMIGSAAAPTAPAASHAPPRL